MTDSSLTQSVSPLTRPGRRGTTVIELTVVLFLVVTVGTIIATVLWQTFKTTALQTTRGELQVTSRTAVDRISRHVRAGAAIVDTQDSYTTAADVLIVKVASIDINEEIIANSHDYFVYLINSADQSQMQEVIIAAAGSSRTSGTQTVLKNLESVTFQYFDSGGVEVSSDYTPTKQVKITLSATRTRYKTPISVEYSNLVTLRNK